MNYFSEAEFQLARFLIRTFGLRRGVILYNIFASDRERKRAGPLLDNSGIKVPAFYDISHWKIVNDWYHISPYPLLMGTKATQGTSYKDPTFPEYFTNFKTIVQCHRLAYHFFEKTLNPTTQANWFVDYIEQYISNEDILCLDFEQGGETASMLWAFMDRLSQRRPNNPKIIYSRKNLMDPIVMTTSEASYFKQFMTWPAGYPYPPIPDHIPSGYIPRQDHWGPPGAWQYTDSGHVGGIDGDTDCNTIEPPLYELIGETPEPPLEESNPFQGVDRITGRRFDSNIYVTIIDPLMTTFEVVHEQPLDNGLFLVSQECRKRNAQLGWNGDEWNKSAPLPARPITCAWSNGQRYVARVSTEPSLNIKGGNQSSEAEIVHQTTGREYNTSSGRRYIVQNGSIPSYMYGNEPQYTERHPRGLTGISRNGQVIMITVDGRSDISRGITLLEGAQLMLEFGAYTAFDRGGGGDAVDVMNGVIQNVPCDTGTDGQPGVERAVVQGILVYAEDNMQEQYQYDATANGDNTRIRPNHDTNNTAYNAGTSTYPRGTLFSGDALFIAPTNLSNGGTIYQKAGDKWLDVKLINGQPPRDGQGNLIDLSTKKVWVAILHMGSQQICTLVDHGDPQPPEPSEDVPPQAVMVQDDKGVLWKSTGFTKVT